MKILLSSVSLDSFFFQAEDGIRDYKVTGVQTCALPIYISPIAAFRIRYLLVSGAGITSSDTIDSRSRPVRNYWKILLARGTAKTVEGRPEGGRTLWKRHVCSCASEDRSHGLCRRAKVGEKEEAINVRQAERGREA